MLRDSVSPLAEFCINVLTKEHFVEFELVGSPQDWTHGPALVDRPLWIGQRGALKKRGCSGLRSLTVPVDCPQGLDLWTVPCGSAAGGGCS